MTNEEIEAVLSDFRQWLAESARPQTPTATPEPIDLHTLVGQFTALRQEVNLQTRAVRAQQEQNAETLKLLTETIEQTTSVEDDAADPTPEDDRPLLKALIETADVQSLALRELKRLAATLEAAESSEPPRSSWLGRLVGVDRILQELRKRPEAAYHAKVESAAAGLAMGLQRIERLLAHHGLTPMNAENRPFDPDQMEAIEVVVDASRKPGEVVDEVRRGWHWNGRVFRFAQVRVAKAPINHQEG